MAQQKTNEGCKGHYWTKVENIEDMKASEHDTWWYNRCVNEGYSGLRHYHGRLDL